MNVDLTRRPLTLGERLAREAQRMARGKIPTSPWLHALEPVWDQVHTFAAPAARCFDRLEMTDGRIPHPAAPSPVHGEEEGYGGGMPLAADIQAALRAAVGPGVERLRVHQDASADAYARAHRADAVTLGTHVFFRDGRFQPYQRAGFALLAHEATHVAEALRPDVGARRATEAGVRDEERRAAAREHTVLNAAWPAAPREPLPSSTRSPILPVSPPPVIPSPALPASPPAAMQPMAAPEDRYRDNATPTTPVATDVEALRQALYHDLMSRIRTDFERGG